MTREGRGLANGWTHSSSMNNTRSLILKKCHAKSYQSDIQYHVTLRITFSVVILELLVDEDGTIFNSYLYPTSFQMMTHINYHLDIQVRIYIPFDHHNKHHSPLPKGPPMTPCNNTCLIAWFHKPVMRITCELSVWSFTLLIHLAQFPWPWNIVIILCGPSEQSSNNSLQYTRSWWHLALAWVMFPKVLNGSNVHLNIIHMKHFSSSHYSSYYYT